ncbi:hypothetical protein FPSE_07240 [Fusarium pseudograminearum CS3096]|uniref:Uncharacterized protein n=1 Tax=Fusarium pseudograminearum (strain CS3096) TaxID=1028729 RepID=K3VHQ3_FUSPC|nr:hypothetical protein FPSE_07240 [Fusarium pseudograminearum CS3096]EKJ72603.1 hypothetical protein FPSE_07240 [Fusarium pseudograminearum CS3096]
MSTSTVSTIGNRPVINYGLEHDLLCDHRGAPYRFRDQIRQLQKTAESSQPGGIVEQADLTTAHLPRPKILFEPPAKHEDYQVPVDPVVSAHSVFSFLGRTKRLRFPPESLDLGYDTRGEFEQYLDDIQSARSCNIIKTWLPLAQVNNEKDEGLEFPSTVSRWQTLALREMEVDEKPYPTHDMESTYNHHILPKTFTLRQIREIFALRNCSNTYLKPVSPPLSPASEPYEPFMLKPDVAVIDLTSEPSSPIDMVIERLHSNADNDHLDPQPPGLSGIFSSPPTARAALLSPKSKKLSELKLDLPLLSSSPESSQKPNSMMATLMPTVIDSQATLQPEVEQEGIFEEAFQTFLDSKHYEANRRLEQERLNPADALLRLPIPAADFDIPNPEWSTHLSSSKEQFRWLVQQLSSAFHLPFLEDVSRLDSSLKWTPIPPGSGRISLTETMIQLGSLSRELLSLQPPQLCSQDYAVPRPKPMIFQLLSDEDIEQEAHANIIVSHQDFSKEIPTNKGDEPSNMSSLDDLLGSRRQTLGSQIDGNGKKRLLADTNSTTSSSLLFNFMQLRQPKRSKTRSDTPLPTVQFTPRPQSNKTNVCSNMQEVAPKALKDAPAPLVNMPGENCRYIISMDLSRNILSFIERSWPHVELIDRDFTQHNTVTWSPGSTQRIESISPLAFEADVSLCPAAGLIMTTILRVKQKPLPGSTTLSSFRERVKLVGEKYECLYILVSEANTQGEYVGSPSASDIAGYADFVRFTTSLRAGISTYLVSGAEETLSKWALSIMSRYSSAALQLGQFLDFRDSQWDVFFRRAGLNICAAQVLTRLLMSEYGQYGLANFLNMSVSDRISKYGQIMGGKRILSNVSSILDQEWM